MPLSQNSFLLYLHIPLFILLAGYTVLEYIAAKLNLTLDKTAINVFNLL